MLYDFLRSKRRERDSNPRRTQILCGFQDRRLKPDSTISPFYEYKNYKKKKSKSIFFKIIFHFQKEAILLNDKNPEYEPVSIDTRPIP